MDANNQVNLNDDEMEQFNEGNSLVIALKILKKYNFKIGSNITYVPAPMSFIPAKTTLQQFLDGPLLNFDILLKVNNINNNLDRLFQVHRYIISSLYHLPVMEKSLNSILGETLRGQFDVDMGTGNIESNNYYCCEQLSFNPSSFACTIYNQKEGIKVLFNYTITLIFMGTYTKLEFNGKTIIVLEHFNEVYESNLPFYAGRYLRGFGEFVGEVILTSNQYKLTTQFYEKPLIGGIYDKVQCDVIDIQSNEITHRITGQWSNELKIKNLKSNQTISYYKRPSKSSLINNNKDTSLTSDSNNVWRMVFQYQDNNKLKSIEIKKVEQQQRQLLNEIRNNNIQWIPNLFYKNDLTNNMWYLK